jgi:acyl-CoA synthetase (AMP-forming)/AMP-acid ligase II
METSIAEINEQIAAAMPDRIAVRQGGRLLTFAELCSRSRRLANHLLSTGLGKVTPRDSLQCWQSGQDHVALLMYNCPEYIEAMFGCFKSRTVPVNVNYRYTAHEVVQLLTDAGVKGLIFQSTFCDVVSQITDRLPAMTELLQVADDSRNPLLPGASWYEEVLASASQSRPTLEWSPDDLFILYTGGTTGAPKGTLWRQTDWFYGMCEIADPDFVEPADVGAYVSRVTMLPEGRQLITAPLMHGAAAGASLYTMHAGQTVLLQRAPRHFDASDVLSTIEDERATSMTIVGDAFARPLLAELRNGQYDLSSLKTISSAGATLNIGLKAEILSLIPDVTIRDGLGSSETGGHARLVSNRSTGAAGGVFLPYKTTCLLDAARQQLVRPGNAEIGWIGKSGRIPLGYLNDAERTNEAFAFVDGVRYAIPGDRGRLRVDGLIEFLGRDSATINSGGEKVFSEEVEQALRLNPSVLDAMVCGRASERWGQEVTALIVLRDGATATPMELNRECSKYLARYKLPRAIKFVRAIQRSVTGKPDYRWAMEQIANGVVTVPAPNQA